MNRFNNFINFITTKEFFISIISFFLILILAEIKDKLPFLIRIFCFIILFGLVFSTSIFIIKMI